MKIHQSREIGLWRCDISTRSQQCVNTVAGNRSQKQRKSSCGRRKGLAANLPGEHLPLRICDDLGVDGTRKTPSLFPSRRQWQVKEKMGGRGTRGKGSDRDGRGLRLPSSRNNLRQCYCGMTCYWTHETLTQGLPSLSCRTRSTFPQLMFNFQKSNLC